jgi:hypothetical protein
MIALYEIIFSDWSNWGEKTPLSDFSVPDGKKWTIMNDSNIIARDENIQTFNSKNCNSNIGPSINDIIENSIKSVLEK